MQLRVHLTTPCCRWLVLTPLLVDCLPPPPATHTLPYLLPRLRCLVTLPCSMPLPLAFTPRCPFLLQLEDLVAFTVYCPPGCTPPLTPTHTPCPAPLPPCPHPGYLPPFGSGLPAPPHTPHTFVYLCHTHATHTPRCHTHTGCCCCLALPCAVVTLHHRTTPHVVALLQLGGWFFYLLPAVAPHLCLHTFIHHTDLTLPHLPLPFLPFYLFARSFVWLPHTHLFLGSCLHALYVAQLGPHVCLVPSHTHTHPHCVVICPAFVGLPCTVLRFLLPCCGSFGLLQLYCCRPHCSLFTLYPCLIVLLLLVPLLHGYHFTFYFYLCLCCLAQFFPFLPLPLFGCTLPPPSLQPLPPYWPCVHLFTFALCRILPAHTIHRFVVRVWFLPPALPFTLLLCPCQKRQTYTRAACHYTFLCLKA